MPALGTDLSLRGVWVSTVYNLDYPSEQGLSEKQLRAEADNIIENARSYGLNAIFLQVRPCSDALYPSELFPWSKYVSGTQGTAPDGGFDPLAYFVEQCHAKGLQLHAWINPYRITRQAADSREAAFAQLADGHIAWQHPECVIFHTDGCLYFDPGLAQSRQIIVNGALEILRNYDVDGIHLDDYFYPDSKFDDANTFADLGESYGSLDDFRRDSVTQLIRQLYAQIKAYDETTIFGVSPFGVWANQTSNALGSDTISSQSYFDHYADTRKWVTDGLLDYIMPQLYWPNGSVEADFQTLLNWWSDVTNDTDVRLYVGLGAYRLLEAEPGSVWEGTAELQRQLKQLEESTAEGAVFFRYGSILDNHALAQLLHQQFDDRKLQSAVPCSFPGRLTVLTPTSSCSLLPQQALQVSCTAAFGSKVLCVAGTATTALYSDLNGHYSGSLILPAPSADSIDYAPLLISEKNGFVQVKLATAQVTQVNASDPAKLLQVSWSDNEDGTHQVFFNASALCAAQFHTTGNALILDFTPCETAILFEDPFFDKVDGSNGSYILTLKENAANYKINLLWSSKQICLQLSPLSPAADNS